MTEGKSGPEVTIVVPTRNRHELADRAVASALAQTVGSLQVIVVDDGSDRPYVPPEDDRVQLVRTEVSLGPSAARNVALERAVGRWIMFLDDDDVLLPDMIENALAGTRDTDLPPPVSVLCGAQIVDSSGEVLATRIPPSLERGSHYFLEEIRDGYSFQTHATLVAPVEVVREIGGWDEELRASEHDDFFLRLNRASSILGLSSVGYHITAHSGPRLSKAVLERAKGMQRTVEKHESVFLLHRRRFSRYLRTIGITYLRAGRWGAALAATTRAVRVDPLGWEGYLWWLAALAGPWPVALRRRVRGSRGWTDRTMPAGR